MTLPKRSRWLPPLAGAALLLLASQARAQSLSPPLREWLSCEQGRLSRNVDTSRLMALTNHQDPRFAPERGATFGVKSYWVDADKMHSFTGLGMPRDLKQLFVRTQGSRQQIRLLVHPESEGLYRQVLAGAQRSEDFMATATASSRTLLVWPQNRPDRAFFGKVSLDKEIGGVRRTISQGEVARSVGVNNVLAMAKARRELPASFKYVPEVFSTIPRGMQEGGMVIRAIPREVTRGQVRVVPLFSLYAEPAGGGRPLLADMIEKSGMTAEAFVKDKIVKPFAKQWIELTVRSGIIPEPHAQNVLLELGRDGLPTGKFVHRDFGGFNIDFDHRRQSGRALPRSLPRIGTVENDYKIGRYGSPKQLMGRNLDSFFYGGFIYNLDQQMPSWGSKGYLPRQQSIRQGMFKQMLVRELEQQYSAMTGRRVNLRGDLRNAGRMAEARQPKRPGFFRRLFGRRN